MSFHFRDIDLKGFLIAISFEVVLTTVALDCHIMNTRYRKNKTREIDIIENA